MSTEPSTCPQGYSPHPDFENVISDDRGLVATVPGNDGTPTPIAHFPTASVKSAKSFNQWYHNKAGINTSTTIPLTLTETSPGSGIYSCDNSSFFPVDNQLLGNQGQGHNYSFTMALHTTFKYVSGQTFDFAGDDDAWVFINNNLVIDLGGVHGAESASVNLDTLGLTVGQKYTFDIFYAERHTSQADLSFQTSIVFDSPAGGSVINTGLQTVVCKMLELVKALRSNA
jgi:fibro-slime domain-containing protein